MASSTATSVPEPTEEPTEDVTVTAASTEATTEQSNEAPDITTVICTTEQQSTAGYVDMFCSETPSKVL